MCPSQGEAVLTGAARLYEAPLGSSGLVHLACASWLPTLTYVACILQHRMSVLGHSSPVLLLPGAPTHTHTRAYTSTHISVLRVRSSHGWHALALSLPPTPSCVFVCCAPVGEEHSCPVYFLCVWVCATFCVGVGLRSQVGPHEHFLCSSCACTYQTLYVCSFAIVCVCVPHAASSTAWGHLHSGTCVCLRVCARPFLCV